MSFANPGGGQQANHRVLSPTKHRPFSNSLLPMTYAALTEHDRAAMLETIGVADIGDLFADIPRHLRDKANPDIGPALSEIQVRREMSALAARNLGSDRALSFLGAGMYDHYIPALVPALALRGEFMTAYTPYQAEVSQGTLQVIYEFQTLICQLTQMEMANASLYDGATALAEALIMAQAITKRPRLLLPATLSPFSRRVAQTYLQGLPFELETIADSEGIIEPETLRAQLDESVAAVVIQQPNFYGNIEDARALTHAAHAVGALVIVVFNPISLGILEAPGAYDTDIAVGEGQPLGIPISFGGPGLGLFCCRKKYARFAPGRLVGQTTDEQGRSGFTLTLQTREQHIRREKATSNICSNQALCALMASIYLAAMGPQGMRDVATQAHHKAHYAAQVLAGIPGCSLRFERPFFHEFALNLPRPVATVNAQLVERGIIGGYDLSQNGTGLEAMLICCTEKHTREDIDAFATALREIL